MDERIKYLYRQFLIHKEKDLVTYHMLSGCPHAHADREKSEVVYVYEYPHNGDWHSTTVFYLSDPLGTWAQNFRDGGRYSGHDYWVRVLNRSNNFNGLGKVDISAVFKK